MNYFNTTNFGGKSPAPVYSVLLRQHRGMNMFAAVTRFLLNRHDLTTSSPLFVFKKKLFAPTGFPRGSAAAVFSFLETILLTYKLNQ